MPHRMRDTHLRRYRQIAEVLARHGLGYLVATFGLERLVALPRTLIGRVGGGDAHTSPERLRMALEELGTTFIKLGQIASTRADLLPPDFQTELTKLQDAAPPVPFAVVQELLATELGQPIDAVFATFEQTPLASASIGQVHAATLIDGTEVVVKVRRPGVVEQVEEDLDILRDLAAAASRHWELADRYDVDGLAQEFARTLWSELDYRREGRNAERFVSNFADDPRVHIPRVFWETTTAPVLTLERIHGIKISNQPALAAAGVDRIELAERAARIMLTMVFEHGFFHADPHPGNFLIEADGHIGLIDLGMVGLVDERTQAHLAWVLMAVASRDTDRLIDTLFDLGIARQQIDRSLLRHDLDHLLALYYERPLGEIEIGVLLNDVFAVMRQHHLQLPPNLALLVKMVMMSEGLGRQLDPNFQLTTVLAPYAERLMLQQLAPSRLVRQFGQASFDIVRLSVDLPRQIRRITSELERGGLEIGMHPVGVEPLVARLEQLANRIVLGIITAAFVIGLAMLVSVYRPPGWDEWAGAVFALGFLIAVTLGIYLAWSILRSPRR